MNHVQIIGRLGKDPDIRSSAGEKPQTVARYTLAVDRKYTKGGNKETDWISCICFGKQAEFAEKYLKKGIKIAVTGRIQTGSFTNKDGQTVYTTDVVVEEQEFCESKNAELPNMENPVIPPSRPREHNEEEPIPQPRKIPSNIDPEWAAIPDGISEDELPFGG